MAPGAPGSPQESGTPRPSRVVGVQIAPHSLLDEGITTCLDFLQATAGVNTLFLYSQTYHLGTRPLEVLADDHPSPPRDPAGRRLPHQWVRLPGAPFAELPVRHEPHDPAKEHADRDLFAELAEPCRQRGIRLYARILEAGMRRAERIPGYGSVAALDLDGRPGHGPCWNHPGYREWIRATVEETMRHYPLDGFQYGAERVGPLSDVLFRGQVPSCFCSHCEARNRGRGIDPERARTGYRKLLELIRAIESGDRPVDGTLTAVLRVVFRHPEVLAWNQSWFESDQEIQTLVHRTAKAVRPEADVGQHIDHQRSSWDLFYRAAIPYAEMARENDFIKPIVYHDILGPRLREWVIERMQDRVLADLGPDQALGLFYALFGHAADREPGFEELPGRGLSPEYVFREIRRCVLGAGGAARVYAGIGLDVPTYTADGMARFPCDPETAATATRRALDAGAAGVIASREYDEISRASLEAFGRGAAG